MSIEYNTMYNITAGIYMAFQNKSNKKRILSVKHSHEKREKLRPLFPINKYNTYTKENFIIANLYVNFEFSPSSLVSAIKKLNEIENQEIIKFKNNIIYYKKYIKEDIDRILSEETSVDLNYMIKQYRKGKIKWFTFYFYLVNTENAMEKISNSRINSRLLHLIEKLMLYVTFSEDSKDMIKQLMKQNICIN